MTAGAGLTHFETKLSARGLPWQEILAMIQAIVALFSGGICPKPPATKADLTAVRFKRARLAAAYRRESGVNFATAFAHADLAIATLGESSEEEVSAFIADCRS